MDAQDIWLIHLYCGCTANSGHRKCCAAKKSTYCTKHYLHLPRKTGMVIREDYLHLALWVEQEILEKIKSISIYYRGKFLKKDLFLKTTMRYHFTPVRMSVIQNLQAINAGEGVEKREPSCTAGGNAN